MKDICERSKKAICSASWWISSLNLSCLRLCSICILRLENNRLLNSRVLSMAEQLLLKKKMVLSAAISQFGINHWNNNTKTDRYFIHWCHLVLAQSILNQWILNQWILMNGFWLMDFDGWISPPGAFSPLTRLHLCFKPAYFYNLSWSLCIKNCIIMLLIVLHFSVLLF